MLRRPAFAPLEVTFALVLLSLSPLSACDKSELPSPKAPAQPAAPVPAAPSLFSTVLDHAPYGTAKVTANGNTLTLDLPGGGEGGAALTLKPMVTAMTVVGFSLDAPAPMNLRLTRSDGTIEYLSTEGRGFVVLGPDTVVEALIYSSAKIKANLTLTSTAPCGGDLACGADGRVSIRIGPPGALALIAEPYGAAAISQPEPQAIKADRGTPSGEYGFTLAPESESAAPLLLEFTTEASEPINVVVQRGETRNYVSSKQGWIRIDPGSTILAYTPGPSSFEFGSFRLSACTMAEPRCVP